MTTETGETKEIAELELKKKKDQEEMAAQEMTKKLEEEKKQKEAMAKQLEEEKKQKEEMANKLAEEKKQKEEMAKKLEGQTGGPESKKRKPSLKDMSPNSKEDELSRRKDLHRENSKKWHAKWQQKGAPKDSDASPEEPPQEEPVETKFPKYEPVIDPDALEEAWPETNSISSWSELESIFVHWVLIEKVCFQPSSSCVLFPFCFQDIVKDMRNVRVLFMRKWTEYIVATVGGVVPTQIDANNAWLSSDLRAQIMAARKGKQY